MLNNFEFELKRALSKCYTLIGPKLKAMMRNITEIRRLFSLLLNSDCVNFFIAVVDLRCDSFDMVNPE